MRRLLEFLGEHEVPLQLAMPLYRKYGDRALEIIRGNPYLLVDRELGVDFSNADALALSMGMEGDDWMVRLMFISTDFPRYDL